MALLLDYGLILLLKTSSIEASADNNKIAISDL